MEEKLKLWFEDLLAFIEGAHGVQEISDIYNALDLIDETMLEFLLNGFGEGFSCRNLYSFVVYL